MFPIGAIMGGGGGTGGPSNTSSGADTGGGFLKFGNVNFGGAQSDGVKYAVIAGVAIVALLYFKGKK